ncbi:uncharacterized protein METZ01_LOCUS450233, partial [marine metagenome]
RAYLRHCFHMNEIIGLRMITLHNVYYYMELMRRIRQGVTDGNLEELLKEVEVTGPPLAGRQE